MRSTNEYWNGFKTVIIIKQELELFEFISIGSGMGSPKII